MLAEVGWPDVAIAVVAGVPGIIAAVFAGLARQEVKTHGGNTLGKSVEKTEAIITRSLGERRGDRLKSGGGHGMYERADDDKP